MKGKANVASNNLKVELLISGAKKGYSDICAHFKHHRVKEYVCLFVCFFQGGG